MAVENPFGLRAYRLLWLTNFASQTAVLIQAVAASWTMVSLGSSAQMVALVLTAASLPIVLVSPIAGAIADRMDRPTIMIFAQLLLAVVSLALLFISSREINNPAFILVCIFASGCGLAFNGPAFMASVIDTVPRGMLPSAISYNALALNAARSLGPAIGGALIGSASALANFTVSASVSVLSIIVLFWLMRSGPRSVACPSSEPLLPAIEAGVRYAAGSSQIRAAFLRTVVFGAIFNPAQALMPLVAHRLLNGGAPTFGMLSSSFGVGALSGALLTNQLRQRLPAELIVQFCTFSSALAILAVALSSSTSLTGLSLFVIGSAWVVAYSIFNTSIQLASPQWVAGRILSLYQMAAFIGFSLGAWLGGIVADRIGIAETLTLVSGVGLASMFLGLISPIKPLELKDWP